MQNRGLRVLTGLRGRQEKAGSMSDQNALDISLKL